jgi:hypothetical protein
MAALYRAANDYSGRIALVYLHFRQEQLENLGVLCVMGCQMKW